MKAWVAVGDQLTLPGLTGGLSNVSLTDDKDAERHSHYVFPPAGPGRVWEELKTGQLEADLYKYDARRLTVSVWLEEWLAQTEGLMLCLWTGGSREDTRMVGCAPVTVIE